MSHSHSHSNRIQQRLKSVLGVCILASTLAACSTASNAPSNANASSPNNPASTQNSAIIISGTASYMQRIAMAPDAVLTVVIEDVTLADAPAKLVAQQRIPFNARQVPLPFSLSVDSALIDAKHTYNLRASISVGSKLMFTTTEHHAVLVDSKNATIDVMMQMVAQEAPVNNTPTSNVVTLDKTHWKLVELNNKAISKPENMRENINLVLDIEQKSVSGFSGCNRLIGGVAVDGNHIKFGQLAGTMMACEQAFMDQEREFVNTIAHATQYKIQGKQMVLMNNQTVLARFIAH